MLSERNFFNGIFVGIKDYIVDIEFEINFYFCLITNLKTEYTKSYPYVQQLYYSYIHRLFSDFLTKIWETMEVFLLYGGNW